ncbi:HD-GYP domain-containing protein [Sporomusa malonica]|uniref:HDIG domain-containing protein n=1 Tax=Sporomusa malonica TaxID=112901 RepID=A0A1W2DG68_9FIRM|nr:HD domain-containing phosphohydrolase [Sporomusa malonica]SMC95966.1 HDIG domain-containing protein [Sporomusa malonica]
MSTRMIAVKDLVSGMIIGEPVLSASGKILLGKDVVITARTISLLLMWGVHTILVVDESTIPTSENTPAQPAAIAGHGSVMEDFSTFFNEYDSVITTAAQSFDFIRKNNRIPVQELKDTSFSIFSTVLSTGPAIMDYLLVSDYNLADKVARHSVMVAFISSIIGRKLKLTDQQLHVLILAGLLHDVGKLVIAKEADNHPNSHVINGGKLLQHVPSLPQEVLMSVLQHHECMDGSGCPLGSVGDKIHLYARIIAVADYFHQQAYTGEHANPFPVLESMSKEMFSKLDQGVCQPFIRHVRDCLINSPVLLSDERTGQVIFFNTNKLDQPIIKTDSGTIIDLAATKHISIKRLVNLEYLANAN